MSQPTRFGYKILVKPGEKPIPKKNIVSRGLGDRVRKIPSTKAEAIEDPGLKMREDNADSWLAPATKIPEISKRSNPPKKPNLTEIPKVKKVPKQEPDATEGKEVDPGVIRNGVLKRCELIHNASYEGANRLIATWDKRTGSFVRLVFRNGNPQSETLNYSNSLKPGEEDFVPLRRFHYG